MTKTSQEPIQGLQVTMLQQREIGPEEKNMRRQPVNLEDVVSVYEGKAGTCCCGCAGTRYFSPMFAEQIAACVSEHLIRQPKPEQFNQDKIVAVTGLVNTHIECGATECLGGLYFLELNGLRYHVMTTAECERMRLSAKELPTKNRQQPTATGSGNWSMAFQRT